jgi:fermentation-respiration switch protein FrsA (DUF1100 family)
MHWFRKRWLRILLGCLLAMVLGVVVVERVVAYKLHEITHPPRMEYTALADESGKPIRKVPLKTADGLRLTGWFLPPRNGATIIVQHGYRASSAAMLPVGLMLARHGYGVLWFDFRAHGQSEGDQVSFGLHEVHDTNAALDFLLQQPEVDPAKIGLLGVSMGGATGILAAAENYRIQALAVEAVFAELRDQVGVGIQVQTSLPARPLDSLFIFFAEQQTGDELGNVSPLACIGRISPRAVLIMQGGEDARILPDSGQRLLDAAGEPKEHWHEPSAAHCALFTCVPQRYEQRVVSFFDRHLLPHRGQGASHR